MNTHSLSVRVGVAVLTLAVGLIGGISPLQAQDKNPKKVAFTETRGKRYGEVFLVKPDGIFMYNTTGLSLIRLRQPCSGYDLRGFFAGQPMATFSDSPGSIYPALKRLEKSGLVPLCLG
jgi:hypothetical protein